MVQVKVTPEQAMKAQRGVQVYLYAFFNLGARCGRVVRTRSDSFTPRKVTRYPLYSKLVGPQGQSKRVWNLLSQPGFDPRTAQPVASRYTDWAIPAHMQCVIALLFARSVCWNLWFHCMFQSSWHWCHMFSVSRRATSVSDWLHESMSFEKSSNVGPCVIGSLIRLLRPWRLKQPAYPKCQ